jgi:hypothetical protein
MNMPNDLADDRLLFEELRAGAFPLTPHLREEPGSGDADRCPICGERHRPSLTPSPAGHWRHRILRSS